MYRGLPPGVEPGDFVRVKRDEPRNLLKADKITVRNLQVVANAGVDVWGRQKKQRALITATVFLAKPFDTAARADSLDNSTIHYGILSKDLLQAIADKESEWMSTSDFTSHLFSQITTTAIASQTILAAFEVDTFYLKGSMFGDGVGYRESTTQFSNGVEELYFRNLRIPCIIGVNPNERLQKQPVVVNLWIEKVKKERIDDYPKLETAVFETLEALSTKVVEDLQKNYFTSDDAGSSIRLRVEKPLAVPFADAPVIEILRAAVP
ncbi:hypothetical protein DM02DRAFT_595407 [Periconia macrospinosa]|uniref:dihydroneopterin aldolase n=1 Tax=Periconia macrospinosa TaxID=97972 RepID=A0A2V1DKY9_9PLEO|nr:hypothetical protein DM02DRAFT_595407 [Periconia macrospinosa]